MADTKELLSKIARLKDSMEAETDAEMKERFRSKIDSLQKQVDDAEKAVAKQEEKVEKQEDKAMDEAEKKLQRFQDAMDAETDPDIKAKFQKKIEDLQKQLKGVKEQIAEEKKEIKEQKKEIEKASKEVESAEKQVRKQAIKKAEKQVESRQKVAGQKKKRKKEIENILSRLADLIERNPRLREKYSNARGGSYSQYPMVDLKRDAGRASKPFGYRFKGKGNNRVPRADQRDQSNVYYEGRANRADVYPRRREKLSDGGELFADGGEMAKGGMAGHGKLYFVRFDTGDVSRSTTARGVTQEEAIKNARKSLKLGEEKVIAVAEIKKKNGVALADGGKPEKSFWPTAINSGINTRQFNKKIKDWYIKTYPTDDLGEEINDKITFRGLWAYMSQGGDVYEYLEVGDSIVRERVFERLSEILDVDYDVVYDKWLVNGRDNKLTLKDIPIPKSKEEALKKYEESSGDTKVLYEEVLKMYDDVGTPPKPKMADGGMAGHGKRVRKKMPEEVVLNIYKTAKEWKMNMPEVTEFDDVKSAKKAGEKAEAFEYEVVDSLTGETIFSTYVEKGEHKYAYKKGGKTPSINDVREDGELVDSQMIDEGYVSNAGEQEFYKYQGKTYVITTWNENAEEHKDGEEEISIWEDEYKKGGKTKSQGYDDREDESLAARRGKTASKDLKGTKKEKEKSRRDDAGFEKRTTGRKKHIYSWKPEAKGKVPKPAFAKAPTAYYAKKFPNLVVVDKK